MTMAFEENGFFVKQHESGDWIVFCPSTSGTHAESDSAYASGSDGLSIAIARALYLSRGAKRGHAKEAMQIASEYMGKAKQHGRKMRDAVAAFDADFLA